MMGQFYFRFRNNMFERLNHTRVNYELAAGLALTVGFLAWTGFSNWFFVAVVPFMVQNYLVFSYISTNHNLSPLTKENDPLINSLTVTNHPILEFLHLNFGYHVEHHLFPSMSPAHAKTVHRLLKKNYPETYQVMPKFKALRELYRTARIYKNHTELVHPYTNELFPTLGMVEEVGAVNVLPTENISLVVETIDAEPNALA